MAMNPMQRKARNSFLLGFLVMLVLAALIIGFLLFQINLMKTAEEEVEEKSVEVCILAADVEAGTELSAVTLVKVKEKNALGKEADVLPKVLQKYAPSNFVKEEQLSSAVAKIKLTKGTILSADMLAFPDEMPEQSLRTQEYNTVLLPSKLAADNYIDIRLQLPSGQDYIVIAKKRVVDVDVNTVWLNMTEAEMIIMTNAIVESYVMKGSLIYATVYTEPGLNDSAVPTYAVSGDVYELIKKNPNITDEALNGVARTLAGLLNNNRENGFQDQRNAILNAALSEYEIERKDNVEAGIKQQREAQVQKRQSYLGELDEV